MQEGKFYETEWIYWYSAYIIFHCLNYKIFLNSVGNYWNEWKEKVVRRKGSKTRIQEQVLVREYHNLWQKQNQKQTTITKKQQQQQQNKANPKPKHYIYYIIWLVYGKVIEGAITYYYYYKDGANDQSAEIGGIYWIILTSYFSW